jgi:FSR family fosmidomycin resistance protein-like MFS transporter
MPRATLLLVLLVSCAHALMHTYELSLPSVEQNIEATHLPNDPAGGKKVSGWMQFAWRLPLGLGAFLAGWLVDRFGARRMLAIYLLGCGGMSLLAGFVLSLPTLFVVMCFMGIFACIYHPAGLALLSKETDIHNRGRALGIHGVFGSAGIGAAPFIAGLVLTICYWLDISHGWRVYYLVLAVPGILLGLVFVYLHIAHRQRASAEGTAADTADDEEDSAHWGSFFLLTSIAALMGFVYTAVLSFLPRYLDDLPRQLEQMGVNTGGLPREGLRSYLAGGVLLVGCVAQYTAGRFARYRLLEIQFCGICFCSAPCLLWMANATGIFTVVAAATFALFHFMHQPIYNSMIAKYTPRHRRSLAYGFSFAMGLGLGSLGAIFAGHNQSNFVIYGTLSAVAAIAGIVSLFLWLRHRPNAGITD